MTLPSPLVQVSRIALALISVAAFLAAVVFGWLFYSFYLKWLFLFENGRYFDPNTEIVYHDSNFVFGILMGVSLFVAIAAAFAARKLK